ncbi:MAG: GntR family transcriptional regulator [Canibacter sp.]
MQRIKFSEVFTPVEHTSQMPLNLQIVTQFGDAIQRGRLTTGAMLPSEADLCEGFHVARSTLRRALRTLEDQHLIERKRGRSGGTTIANSGPIARTPGTFTTLYDMISETARKPRTKLVTAEQITVDEALSDESGFSVGTKLTHLLRFRSANDQAIAVLENWIRPEYLTFDLSRVESESLEALLRASGTRIDHAKFEYRAVTADIYADFLKVDPDTPVINEVRQVFDKEHQYEFSYHYSHPERERVRGVARP